MSSGFEQRATAREEPMDKTKSYGISKKVVVEAYQKVKANKGAAGVDGQSLAAFEVNLKDNLYKIWNRMSSGSYFPPAVKGVEIPKKSGGKRLLGIPTVSDRVAQMVVKIYFEPKVEPYFHPDSYGYRPAKSALDAIAITRQRSWKYDWVLEFDIKGLFDNIDHELLMKAVRQHTDNAWNILYIQRWLKAPFQMPDGTLKEREKGTPQGGVISPVLANLFLHYAFDKWMDREHPEKPFARYADDAVVNCKSKEDAEELRSSLEKRLAECKLELHPTKTRIVYCKDDNRKGDYPENTFDFLGYTFRPRGARNKYGKLFASFIPAISKKAKVAIQQTIRGWRLHLMSDKTLEDISQTYDPKIRGWANYYGRFYKSDMYSIYYHLNQALIRWAMRKYKKLRAHKLRACNWLARIARQKPELFVHWQLGVFPGAMDDRSRMS
jgi:RNA-directed DNA polymerase